MVRYAIDSYIDRHDGVFDMIAQSSPPSFIECIVDMNGSFCFYYSIQRSWL